MARTYTIIVSTNKLNIEELICAKKWKSVIINLCELN